MTPTAKPPRRGKWKWILIVFFVLIVLPIGGMALWTWMTLNLSYSNGERVGYIQKISKKGWVCKTWEGELSMVNLPGAAPQIFSFSVRDDKVAQQLEDAAGKRVSLTYEQHRGVPSNCFGETEYYISSVRVVGQ